jgi:hypothetical protein
MVLNWNGNSRKDFMFVLVLVGVMDEGSWNNVVGKTRAIHGHVDVFYWFIQEYCKFQI